MIDNRRQLHDTTDLHAVGKRTINLSEDRPKETATQSYSTGCSKITIMDVTVRHLNYIQGGTFSLAVPFLWDERRSRWIGYSRRFGVTYCRYHHGLSGPSEDDCCPSRPGVVKLALNDPKGVSEAFQGFCDREGVQRGSVGGMRVH